MITLTRRLSVMLPEPIKKLVKRVLFFPGFILARGSTLATFQPEQLSVSCPICGSARSEPLQTVTVKNHFMLYEHRPWVRKMVRLLRLNAMIERGASEHWSVRYLRCLYCENGFQEFPHSFESVAGYYSYFYRSGRFKDRGKINRIAKELVARYFLHVTSLIPSTRILDVGCAEGIVCKYLADAGFEAYGVEPHPQIVAFAREKLQLRNIINDHYRVGLFPDEYFDGIIIYHVLEHVFPVKEVIDALQQNLKLGGFVMIQVPCMDTPVNAFANDHLTVWSFAGLEKLLVSRGFEIVKCISAPVDFPKLTERVFREDETVDPLKPGTMCLVARRVE